MMTTFNNSTHQPDIFDIQTEEETLSRSSSRYGIVLELGEARQQLGAAWANFNFGCVRCIDPSDLRTTVENFKGKNQI